MKAKKSYGQHFLVNELIAEEIANALTCTDQYKRVLEVGPGQGMLTKYLLKRDFDLLVVEADRDMVAYLEKHYPELKEQIISADFMKIQFGDFFDNEPFGLVGNYPYNISSQILFKMLDHKEQIPEMVGMFQKEVAERVIAPHGSKVYGVVSVLVQAYYDGEMVCHVDREEFNPPPKVQSAVIRLTRKANQDLGCSYKLFRSVVKQAFSQRRKMLRNTMKAFVKSPELQEDSLFRKRPEELSVQDFVNLTNWVQERMDE